MNPIHACECYPCRSGQAHAGQEQHRLINLLLSRLNEQQRRWFAAYAALQAGHGGVTLLAQVSGMDRKTIRRGMRELQMGLVNRPHTKMRVTQRSLRFLSAEELFTR